MPFTGAMMPGGGDWSMDPRVKQLTKREIEFLHHVYLGRKTWEIASMEGVATQTVSNRLQEARSKLGGIDRHRAALLVAESLGWAPGIKLTPKENTLPSTASAGSSEPVANEEMRAEEGLERSQENGVFVDALDPERANSSPEKRNKHDLLTRISMLLTRTAILVATTVALLWVYGRV